MHFVFPRGAIAKDTILVKSLYPTKHLEDSNVMALKVKSNTFFFVMQIVRFPPN